MANNKKGPPSSNGNQKTPKINEKLKEQVELRSYKIQQGAFDEATLTVSRLGPKVYAGISFLCTALSLALYCISKSLDAAFYDKALKYIVPNGNDVTDLTKEKG